MNRAEREQLRAITAVVESWARTARRVLEDRDRADIIVSRGAESLRQRVVNVRRDGTLTWCAIPVTADDEALLDDLVRREVLRSVSDAECASLAAFADSAQRDVQHVRSVTPLLRIFASTEKKAIARDAGDRLLAFHEASWRSGFAKRLSELKNPRARVGSTEPTLDQLFDESYGLAAEFPSLGTNPEVLQRISYRGLPGALATIEKAIASEAQFKDAAHRAGLEVRRQDAWRMLQAMPVDALKKATRERLRTGPLTDAGIQTVAQALAQGARLEHLPGIGETTANRMVAAAQTLWKTTFDETPVRIDIKARPPETTALLNALRVWDLVRKTRGAADDLQRATELASLGKSITRRVQSLAVFSIADTPISVLIDTIDALEKRANELDQSPDRSQKASNLDPWEDFLGRPADYFAMLAELGFTPEDEEKSHGDLPVEVVEAIRNQTLLTDNLNASLRGYQSFGARFALVQNKVIIGDEMGLGKTVEALAVLAHLRSTGSHHFLVICPAAVVTNWMREVESKSKLRRHRLHGQNRGWAASTWERDGGVGVTTYDTLGWLRGKLPRVARADLDCVIVDEAHYIKNPTTQRSQLTGWLLQNAKRSVLLTGTPMENRVEEFRTLIGYVRPDLRIDASDLAPKRFRRQIAPAYLRRNQEDVLTELPELIEVAEWLPMSEDDLRTYTAAVGAGNFMAMRQAAMLSGEYSEKLQRLIEIVHEAEDNGRRVIVFSHFREVLNTVAAALPGQVFGPLTGSVAADQRQRMVDDFSKAGDGAVLVAQIIAGGAGLNIQAASVIIICEPQLKPTIEAQAIARAHRMGQVQSVQVHRLLSEEGVDERITDILATKKQLFDEYARHSETKESSPEAIDISEAELAREVVAAERQRLFQGPLSASSPRDESLQVGHGHTT